MERRRTKSMRKLIATIIICVAVFYVLGVAGGLEQELMTFGQAVARWAVALTVIGASFICVEKD